MLQLIETHATKIIEVDMNCFAYAAIKGKLTFQHKKEHKENTSNVAKFHFPKSVDITNLLHKACCNYQCIATKDSHEIVKFFVERGADINVSGDKNPVMAALKNKQTHLAKTLLEYGAAVTPTSGLLEKAVTLSGDDAELVEMIFERLNKVYTDEEGELILHSAVQHANEEIVKFLLYRGLRVILIHRCLFNFNGV